VPPEIFVFAASPALASDLPEILLAVCLEDRQISGARFPYVGILHVCLDIITQMFAFAAIVASQDRRETYVEDSANLFVSL
jgi:hypothetical protein